ncbi:MAG: hypothetical protein ACQEQL_01205 [Pseudomonadota bacterium]
MRFLLFFGLGLCLFNITALNTAGAEDGEDLRLNLNISPEYEQAKADYEAALDDLSSEQVAELEEFEEFHTSVYMPLMESAARQKTFQACKKVTPDLDETHGREMQHYTLAKFDALETNLDGFKDKLAKIDFIDQDVFGQYLLFQIDMQRQLMNAMAAATSESIIENQDKDGQCEKLLSELKTDYSDAYAPQSTLEAKSARSRQLEGKTASCSIGMSHQTNQNYQISTQIVFMNLGDRPSFEFSTKIYDSRDNPLLLESAWINFGGFDTRFNAQHSPAGSAIMIGRMPPENVVPALHYMKTHDTVFSGAKARSWPDRVVFESPAFPDREIDRMAECVAAMEPEMASPLRAAGFEL